MSYMRANGEQLNAADIAKPTGPDLTDDMLAVLRVLMGIETPSQAERMRLLDSMLAVSSLAGIG